MSLKYQSSKFLFITSIAFIISCLLLSSGSSCENLGVTEKDIISCLLLPSEASALRIYGRNDANLEKILGIKNDPQKPLRFVVLGDTRSDMKTFSKIINLTNSLKPDFVIHTGDMVEKGGESEYSKIVPYFDRFESPLLTVPGNHDISRSKKPFKNFENYFGSCEMVFDLCGVRFILVDNSEGHLTKTQLNAIDKNLVSQNIRMLFMHVPPKPPWLDHTFQNGAKELVNIIKTTGCEYAFFGHVHGYDHRMIGEKCNGYITGGGGAELNGHGFAEEIYHVLLVTVDNGKVDVQMVPLK